MLIVLFGLPGSGKTYVGKIFKKDFGFFFYDADDDLTPRIKKSLSKGEFVTDDMRDEYYAKVLKKINKFKKNYKDLVVSQALPKEIYRNLLKRNFPDTIFILVSAKSSERVKRLESRKHIINKQIAVKVEKIFESCGFKHYVINNNGIQSIQSQIKDILKLEHS